MSNKNYIGVVFTHEDEFGKQVLLQKKDRGYRLFPDYWTVFGGQVEEGETDLVCLVREVREELGLDVSPTEFTFLGETDVSNGKTLRLYTAVFPAEISEIRLSEGCGFAFWYYDELKDLKLIPHEKPFLGVLTEQELM